MHHVSQDTASGLGYRRLYMAGGVAVFCGGAFLAGLSSLGAPGTSRALVARGVDGSASANTAFSHDTVKHLAERLAQRRFDAPQLAGSSPAVSTAAQYQALKTKTSRRVLWRDEGRGFDLASLPVGWLYNHPVELWTVSDGVARPMARTSQVASLFGSMIGASSGYARAASGFALQATVPGHARQSIVEFQGASFLKAIGLGQTFGLSARGLAIDTARATGEEFPHFRAFWIEQPSDGASQIVVHALLDSRGTTGAYRFVIKPGSATTMDVDAILYPRRELSHVGVAPLTSMFLRGRAHQRVVQDFRPAVHNSEGLAIVNGEGEQLWRPLTNPRRLQTSAFLDRNPKGFGLVQRARELADYEDLNARFEKRPTAWVEMLGHWGEGSVELVEIPVGEEIHDNIVAYWRPREPLQPGQAYRYAYRLSWADDVPRTNDLAVVKRTLASRQVDKDRVSFAIDFEGASVRSVGALPEIELSTSEGTVEAVSIARNPDIGGVRVQFEFDSQWADLSELRLSLRQRGRAVSETWLYRWTR